MKIRTILAVSLLMLALVISAMPVVAGEIYLCESPSTELRIASGANQCKKDEIEYVIPDIKPQLNTLQDNVDTLEGRITELESTARLGSATRTVFVTSSIYKGNLGGRAGADRICQQHANNAGLEGTYRAWIGEISTNDPWSDSSFYKSPVPYVRTDGVMVASDWDDLTDGTLLAAIEADEYGNNFRDYDHPKVWTGLPRSGQIGSSYLEGNTDCFRWTLDSTQSVGTVGQVQVGPYPVEYWTKDDSTTIVPMLGGGPFSGMFCSEQAHLYCFEQ